MAVPITTGTEQVLLKARHDPEFRAALVERRSAAAQDAGLELTPNERAILDSVEAALLESLIANMPAVVPQPDSSVLVAGIRPGLPPDPVRGTRPVGVRARWVRPPQIATWPGRRCVRERAGLSPPE